MKVSSIRFALFLCYCLVLMLSSAAEARRLSGAIRKHRKGNPFSETNAASTAHQKSEQVGNKAGNTKTLPATAMSKQEEGQSALTPEPPVGVLVDGLDYIRRRRTCKPWEPCKNIYRTLFNCRCPANRYCTSAGFFYDAYCSRSIYPILWKQNEEKTGQRLSSSNAVYRRYQRRMQIAAASRRGRGTSFRRGSG